MQKRCPAIPMMATRLQPSSQTWKRPSAMRSAASSPTPAIAAQRTAEPQVQGLHQRPETPRHHSHQAPDAPPLRDRARDRPHQGRAPDGPQLPRRQARDAVNAVLAAAGYNFSLVLRWLKGFCGFSSPPSNLSRRRSKPDPSHCSRPTKPATPPQQDCCSANQVAGLSSARNSRHAALNSASRATRSEAPNAVSTRNMDALRKRNRDRRMPSCSLSAVHWIGCRSWSMPKSSRCRKEPSPGYGR